MKARKVEAEERIFHGTMTQPPMMAAMMQPRKMFTQRGNRTVKSLAAEMEFAVMFVPTWAMYQLVAAKKAAARPPCPYACQCLMMSRGFQRGSL